MSAQDAILSGTLDSLARGVAEAMRVPQVRQSVRSAMRASPLVEHKLAFQSFIASSDGRPFLAAVAGALGVTSDQVVQLAARLPVLDFYLPRREHRRSWNANASVVVTATLANNSSPATAVAYLPSGAQVEADASALAGGRTLIVLHRADPTLYRVDPQPAGPGEVIEEDLRDGRYGVTMVTVSVDGQRHETYARTAAEAKALLAGDPRSPRTQNSSDAVTPSMIVCPPEEAGCGPSYDEGPPSPPPGELHVYRFALFGYCDHTGFVCDDGEWRFKTFAPSGEQKSIIYNMGGYDDRTLDARIRTERPQGSTKILAEMYEEDDGGDDKEGSQDLFETDFANRYNNGLIMSRTFIGSKAQCGSDQCQPNGGFSPYLLVNFRVLP